jgi:dual oxidase
LFSASEIIYLRKLKLSDIIKAVTDIKHGDIQENVFFHQEGDPCPQPHQLNATLMEPCMFLKGYDYFQGSEVPYVFGCIVILFIPVALLCSAYGVVKIMNSRRRKIKMKWEVGDKKGTDKMYVKEWLHHSAKRNAKITFGPDEAFHLMNRKGEKLRSVSVKGLENLVCQVSIYILILISHTFVSGDAGQGQKANAADQRGEGP